MPDANHTLNEHVEVLALRAVIDDRATEREAPVHCRARGHRGTRLLHAQQELLVELVECAVAQALVYEAKADHVQRYGCDQAQLRLLLDASAEGMRLLHILFDQSGERVDAVSFDTHPNLECAKPARQIDAQIGEWQAARHQPALRRREIALRAGKRTTVSVTVADENTGNVEWLIHPLMQIEADRVRLLDPCDERS